MRRVDAMRLEQVVTPIEIAAFWVALTACAPVPTAPTRTAPSPTLAATSARKGDPSTGAKLFAQLPCSACHDVTHPYPGGQVAPNLGNIATEAARIVKSPAYRGQATDAAAYLRESIVDPNAYIVPGEVYHNREGKSAMEQDFAQKLTPQQIDDLVAYLMSLQ
jgi:nitric oxide reductase subunit C